MRSRKFARFPDICRGNCGRTLKRKGAGREAPGVMHWARGLCYSCWATAQQAGTLLDYPQLERQRDEVLGDSNILRARGYTTLRAIAAQKGMTHATLEQAPVRARHDGWVSTVRSLAAA